MEAIKINDVNNRKIKESKIIQRILGGETELYEILVRRNNQKLYRVIRAFIKEEDEIEDTMQYTHLEAFERLYQFKQEVSYATWLARIGINEALARVRENGRIYNLSKRTQDFERPGMLELPDETPLHSQKRIIVYKAKQLLEDAVDHLALKYRTAYILKKVKGMSNQEIADALNLTVSNVKVRVHRAKAMLKEKLYELSADKNIFEFGFDRCNRITHNVMRRI